MKQTFDEIVKGGGKVETTVDEYAIKELADHITCKDGTTLSVQASRFHYCTPRNDFGPYNTVEVGFPSVEPPKTWRKHFDGDWDCSDRCGNVYGYVPIEMVREYITSHGGEV